MSRNRKPLPCDPDIRKDYTFLHTCSTRALQTIRRGNLEEFVGANFHNKPLDRMSEPEREELAKVVDEIEARTGLAFAEGMEQLDLAPWIDD